VETVSQSLLLLVVHECELQGGRGDWREQFVGRMALRIVSRKALGMGMGPVHVRGLQSFSLPDLPYDYGALEPVISAEIMHLHHQKHHQTYISNYNKALEQLQQALSKADSPTIVQLQSAIKFNGGGFLSLSLSLSLPSPSMQLEFQF
jgi:Fe-Mn family superoxide dismutase